MAGMTQFSLLGLPQKFSLSPAEIEEAWRRAIALVHPDRFAGRSPAERRVAEQWAGRINEARKELLDPVHRACVLLKLRGVDIGTETDTRMDMDFLLLQMRWREAAEEAGSSGDAAAVSALLAEIRGEKGKLVASLAEAFDGGCPDDGAAREAVRRLMFVEKIRSDVEGLPLAKEKETP